MATAIHMKMKLPIQIEREGKIYVSSCPVLDVYSQGDSEKEAKKNIVEALSIFLASCFEHGTLESVLKQSGFKQVKFSDKPLNIQGEYVDIPISL